MRAPQEHARPVSQEVDHRACLASGLLPHAPRVAALHREVLPEEQARLVSGVIQGVGRNVRMDAQEIEVRFDRAVDVPAHDGVVDVAGERARRSVARAFEEQPFTVHEELPVATPHLAKRRAKGPSVARLAVDVDREVERAQRLGPERARPPPWRVVDAERPRELVRPRSQRCVARPLEDQDVARAAELRPEARLARLGAGVQRHVARDAPLFERSLDAYRSGTRNTHRSALDQSNRSPDAAGIHVRIQKRRLPVRARDRPLRAAVVLRRARHLDGKNVLVTGAQRVRNLERVRHERTLGRAEVLAVEPHVAVVEDAVELQEPPARARI